MLKIACTKNTCSVPQKQRRGISADYMICYRVKFVFHFPDHYYFRNQAGKCFFFELGSIALEFAFINKFVSFRLFEI